MLSPHCLTKRLPKYFASPLVFLFMWLSVLPTVLPTAFAEGVDGGANNSSSDLAPLDLQVSISNSVPDVIIDKKAVAKFQKYITKLQSSLNDANENFAEGKYKKSGKLFADAAIQIEKTDRPDNLKLFAIHYSAAYSFYLTGNTGATIAHINSALDNLGRYRAKGRFAEVDEGVDSGVDGATQESIKRAEMESYYILGDALIAENMISQGQQALLSAINLADEINEEPFARSVNWRLFQEQSKHGDQEEALVTLNRSLNYYQRDKNDFMIATTLYQKGVIQLDNNDYSASYRSFSNAISIAKNHGYLELLGRSYMGLSESSLGIGSYYNAAMNLENAIDIVVSAEMSDVYLPSSRKLINIYRLIGEYEKALYISDKRVQFAIEQQNTTLEAQLYVEKGDTYRYDNDLHNATLLYMAAISTIKNAQGVGLSAKDKDENSITLGDTYYKLTTAYSEMGDTTKTEIYALEAIVALNNLKDKRVTEVYTTLGNTYLTLHLYSQATNTLNTALKMSDKYGQGNQKPYIYERLGLGYKAMGDVKQSIALLEKSLNLRQDYTVATSLGALYILEGSLDKGTKILADAVDYYNSTTNQIMQANSRYNYAVANLKGGNYVAAMSNIQIAHNIDRKMGGNNGDNILVAQDLYTKAAIQYYTNNFADSITNANSATRIVEKLIGEGNVSVVDGYKTMIRQIQHLKIASAIRNNDTVTALRAGEYLNLLDLPQGYANFNLKTLQQALNSSEIMFAFLPADVNTQDGLLDTAVITITRTTVAGDIVALPLQKTKGSKLKTTLQPLLVEQLSSPTPYRFDYPYTDIARGAEIIGNQRNPQNSQLLYQNLMQPYEADKQLEGKVIWFYAVSVYSQIDFEMLQRKDNTLLAQSNRIVYTPSIAPLGAEPKYVEARRQLNRTVVVADKGVAAKGKNYHIENVSTYLLALEEATHMGVTTNYFEGNMALGALYNSLKMRNNGNTQKILPPKMTAEGLSRYIPNSRLAIISTNNIILNESLDDTVESIQNISLPEDYHYINTVILNQCREFGGAGMLSYLETTAPFAGNEDTGNDAGGVAGKHAKPSQYFMRYSELSGLPLGGNIIVMPNCVDTPNFRWNMGNVRSIPTALYFAQASTLLRNVADADESSRIFMTQYMYEAFQEGQNGVDALHTVQERYMNGALGADLTDPKYWNKFRVYANIYRQRTP